MSNKTILKTYFEAGDRPTALQFTDLIDSSLNFENDIASDADAENSTIDNKFITPKTARKSVEKFAPVKKVNGKTPNTSGEITVAIADVASLQSTLDSKQPNLVSGASGNIKTINNASILVDPTNPSVTNIQLATPSDLDLKLNLPVVAKIVTNGVATSSATRADVSGMSFSALATKKYKIEIFGDYQSGSQTVGGSLGFTLSAGSGSIKGVVEMQTLATGAEKKLISIINTTNTSPNSFITSSQVSALDTPNYLSASLYFECIASGTFKLQWGAETAGTTVKLNDGAVMIVTQLN